MFWAERQKDTEIEREGRHSLKLVASGRQKPSPPQSESSVQAVAESPAAFWHMVHAMFSPCAWRAWQSEQLCCAKAVAARAESTREASIILVGGDGLASAVAVR